MKIIEWYFDADSNKTHARIDAGLFVSWFWISGRVAESEILPNVAPLAERMMAEV